MQRAANFQARSAKNKMKPKKMKAMSDFDQGLLKKFVVDLYVLLYQNIKHCLHSR